MTSTPPKGICTAVVLLVGSFLGLVTTGATAAGAGEGEIRIAWLQGLVEVLPTGAEDWIITSTNQLLRPGYHLRTGPNSRVGLLMSDKSVVPLGALTEVEILPLPDDDQESGLSLLKGLLSFFHRDEPGRFRVRTRGANASVRGSEFVLEVATDNGVESTRLSVIDGTVQLSNESGLIVVTNGQQALAEVGQRPRYTAGFIANNVLQWALYYPAVLDLHDLHLAPEQEVALTKSLQAYAAGDLLAALTEYPTERSPGSDGERVYYAALLLSVGQVSEAEERLGELSANGADEQAERLANALRTLIAAVKLQPRSSASKPELPTEFLAESYFEQSQATGDESLKAALAQARAAMDRSADFGFAYARVAELELNFGRKGKAEEALRWARTLTPRNAQALALQGFILASENDPSGAVAKFNEALAIDPVLGNAWLGRGLSRIRGGDRPGGREDLLVAAAMEPQRAILRSYLAKAYQDAGEKAKAATEIRLAKELDEHDPTAWLYSALINQQNNRINEATRDLEKSLELNDNRRLFRSEMLLDQDRAVRSANLASVYRDAGMDNVAIREAAKAVTYDYANSSAHLFMSDSYNELRDPTLFNLRHESVWYNELLLANLLAPVGAVRLSHTLGQLDNVRLFESDRLGLASSTFYRSDGQIQQLVSPFGTVEDTAWAVDLNYLYHEGVRVNDELDSLALTASIKQQLTPDDSLLFTANFLDYSSGDNRQLYDQGNADPTFSFEQEQKPSLLAGYHHQWSPGVHTLLLGAWLNSQAQSSSEEIQRYQVRQTGNSPPLLRALEFDGVSESDLGIYSAELNQVVQNDLLTLVAGGRFQTGAVEAQDYWTNGASDFRNSTLGGTYNESFSRAVGYAYLTIEPLKRLWLTGGLSYDYIEYPEVFASPPLSSGTETADLLGPKAALVWSPVQQVALRGMYSRSLTGYSLEQSVRLEPSQLAGFPQAFRNVLPPSLVGVVPGAVNDVLGLGMDLKFDSGTYLAVQFDRLSSDDEHTIGIFRTTIVPIPPPPTALSFPSTTTEQVDYEENTLLFNLNQTVGGQFVLGASYRFTDASLDVSHPALSPIARPFPVSTQSRSSSYLHQIGGHVVYNHPAGFFSRVDVNYYQQSNTSDSFPNEPQPASQPGCSFVQLDLLVGYRFARRRAELTLGILNLTDTDYRLSPLTYYSELPRVRVFVLGLSFQL